MPGQRPSHRRAQCQLGQGCFGATLGQNSPRSHCICICIVRTVIGGNSPKVCAVVKKKILTNILVFSSLYIAHTLRALYMHCIGEYVNRVQTSLLDCVCMCKHAPIVANTHFVRMELANMDPAGSRTPKFKHEVHADMSAQWHQPMPKVDTSNYTGS